jgi:hypothetical protein
MQVLQYSWSSFLSNNFRSHGTNNKAFLLVMYLLLALTSTVIFGSGSHRASKLGVMQLLPPFPSIHSLMWLDQVNKSPAGLAFLVGLGKLLLVLGSTATLGFGTRDHVFAISRMFTSFELGLIFDKGRGLTTISDSPTTGGGGNLLSVWSSLYNFCMDHIENSGFCICVFSRSCF